MASKMIPIYCAICRKETAHTPTAVTPAEVTFECPDCGHALKFPAGITREELDGLIAKHKEHTEPLIPAAEVEAKQKDAEAWLDGILAKE